MSAGDSFSLFALFQEEARAHAAALSAGLVELEGDAANARRIEPLMRAAHSLKGACRIVNIDEGVELAHALEDMFVAAQEGRIALGAGEIDHALRAADLLAELGAVQEDAVRQWAARSAKEIAELAASFEAVAAGKPLSDQAPKSASHPTPETPKAERQPVELPELPIALDPIPAGDDDPLWDLFREEVRQQTIELQAWLRRLTVGETAEKEPALAAAQAIRGAATLSGATAVAELAGALKALLASAPPALDSIWQILAALTDVIHLPREGLANWSTRHSNAQSEIPPASNQVTRAPERKAADPEILGPRAVAKSEPPEASAPPPPAPEQSAVVRVSAQSLNRLMGLAGESLVQSRWLQRFSNAFMDLKRRQDSLAISLETLAQAASAATTPERLESLVRDARDKQQKAQSTLQARIGEFDDHSTLVEDLNSRLYREVIVSRMRPFGDGAHGFPRLVRDMARQLGKQARLEIDGLTTEVDRDVLEKLEAPLNHLLRNAVDHGLETPGEREAAGKPPAGTIRLEVRHRAGTLAIDLSDDGAGIDIERLRAKIVERNLATADMARSLSEAELLEFLFLPGFSTASAVTEYSGRGVGLDVVLQTIRSIGGSARITTRRQQGTTFHLQLPITLSVLRAVIVDIAGEPYAFPHHRIERLLTIPFSELRSLENKQFIDVDGRGVGVVLATQLFGFGASEELPTELSIVLLSDSMGEFGLLVDDFRGEQDLVVRPLDPRLGQAPNISAGAILDDGQPILIVDVEDLVRSIDNYIQRGTLARCDRRTTEASTRKRILVVDDSITVRELERQILIGQGYDVTVAVDGQDGWNHVRQGSFDLVITDVDMPRLDGLGLVRLMRENRAFEHLPVVIVSYKEREEDRLRGLEVGANYYLTKSSFHDNTFIQAIKDLIGEATS